MSVYTFDSHEQEAEYKRLCLIQDSFDDKSQTHLLKAGLKPGMHCLEVGLGAGSLADWIYKQVGAEGSLLGVDLNCQYIKEHAEYAFFEGDVLALQTSKTFDLIHLRYVLVHNRSADEIIQKLFSLLKPGGKIVVEEPDFTLAKWMDAKDLDACRRVSSAVCKMFEDKRLKPRYGSIVHLALRDAGFKVDEQKSYLHLCSGGEDVAEMMGMSARALQEEYTHSGVCSSEDVKAYIDACHDSESLGVYYGTIAVTATKVKESEEEVTYRQDDGVCLASTDAEILGCFTLMKELRTGLREDGFLETIRIQMEEGYQLYYLKKESEIVCLAGCRIVSNLAWGKHLYIDDLVSRKKVRSLGYGDEMMECLGSMAAKKGCSQIHLDSGVQRFDAHRFYLNKKFRIASHHFVRDL